MSSEPAWREQGGPTQPGAGALAMALSSLNLRYGPGAVRAGAPPLLQGLATGVGSLDDITGCRGLPRGRISRLTGGSSSGAFDLGLVLAAEVSRSAAVAIVDFTLGVDPGNFEAYGGELDNCWLVRPRRPEEGWAAARTLAQAGVALCLLVAEDWSRLTPGAAPAALLTALAEGDCAGLVLGGRLIPAVLKERICLELECWRLDWALAHGDVCGLRLGAQVIRSHLGAPGASCRLQLNFPRPYQRRVGLEELTELAEGEELAGELLSVAGGSGR
ncbi:MAG TPA: hypothetical protein VNH38_01895 [Candidatus Dormibacteraeota bacterium]|nr:hypothetical protein [Candidatus Dormibacteraeota bacterium]